MTRNKRQTFRLSRAARTGIALVLSLSMVLGSVPTGALQALAADTELQDVAATEDQAAGSGAAELQEDAVATEGATAEGTTTDEGITSDETVTPDEGAVAAEESEAPQGTVLEAEAEGVHAQLVVEPGTELPEGSHLVVTSLAGAVEQAAAENGTVVDTRVQGSSDPSPHPSSGNPVAAAAEKQTVTGADVALTGMSDAVDACVAEQQAEPAGAPEATAADAEQAIQQPVVSAAYAIEVVDGADQLVPVASEDAELTVTFPKELVEEPKSVYTVTRSAAQPQDTPQVTEAKGAPVATVAEEQYADAKVAAASVVFAGTAEDVTSNVQVDEATGTARLMAAGAPSVVVTDEPMGAPYNQPSGQDTNRVSLKNDGFTLNLFNYFAVENRNYNTYYPDNHIGNRIRYEGINSTDGTSGSAHPFLFLNGGTDGNGYNYYTGGSASPMQGIVQNELDENYYPVLANTKAGTSLAYLFDETIPDNQTFEGNTIHPKERYGDVDGLFELDQHGYYSYDSNKNYAYYDTSQGDGGSFYVHKDTYARSGGNVYKIGFFPFDQWTNQSNDYVSPGQKDHHLGLTMSGTFTLPETSDGMAEYKNPTTGVVERNPVEFEMGGDDDMLVFIDGVLVLDLGGIHQPVHGAINFTNGTVDIYGDPLNNRWAGTTNPIRTANDTYGAHTPNWEIVNKNVNDNGTNYGTRRVYTATLEEIFGLVNKKWNGAPGSSHRIDVFYLERGSYDSNLLVRFNLPLTPTTDLNVKKEWYKQNAKEKDHHDSIMVQLYQQVKLTDDTYSEPRPYGDPVELKESDGYAYTFTGLPVHSHLESDYYYYTVKEGVVINGQFLAADDGQTISDGYVYGLDSITYEYDDDSTGARTEVYPDQKDAAFHNGNSTPVVGTATIKNEREGKITVQKQWLNSAGEPDQADHSGDEVAVQLVKLTKAATDDSFDNATEKVIEVTTLNAANNWRSGFESDQIVTGDPNVEYVVYEGYMNGSTFVRSNVLTTSSGAYELDSTRYMRTTISESSEDLQVIVDQDSPEHVAQNTRPLYWWIDQYQNRYWLNRTYGVSATELAVNNGSEPELLQDTVTQQLMIPYSAMLIPDDSGSTYDFVVDVSFEESQGLNLTSLAVGSGLSGSSYTITHDGSGYHLRVPAAWAKEHAGEAFTLNIGVSANQTLQNVANADNRARLRVVPTSYVVTGMVGHSAPVQDMWESEDGLQLVEGGTGHAVITNKPHIAADVTLQKTDAQTGDALEGATFEVYENTGEDSYDAVDDTRPAKRFPDAETAFVSGSDGTVVIEDLTPGIYWIIETEAPAGYLVMGPENPIGVVVAADGTVSLVDTNGAAITNPASTEPSIATEGGVITVPNARAYELPAAGGPGAYPFLLVGSFIAALALDRSGELRRKLAMLLRRSARA